MARPHPSPAKTAVRDRVLTTRRRRPPAEQVELAAAIARHALAWEPVRRAATVAAYVSVGGEPGTGPLLDALLARGTRVVLPVVRPDLDLDWATHTGELQRAAMRLLEPTGPRLGTDAVATADVVLVPGLAVSTTGDRLGRGGGCYDRALGRVPVGIPVAVVLHDDEVGQPVPVEPHDRPVTHALTPSGLRGFNRISG